MVRPVRGSEVRGDLGAGALAPIKALRGLRPRDLVPAVPRPSGPRTGLIMGEHQAITTAEWQIGRMAQDELAAASHHDLAAAYDRGFFDDLVTPYLRVTRDQNSVSYT